MERFKVDNRTYIFGYTKLNYLVELGPPIILDGETLSRFYVDYDKYTGVWGTTSQRLWVGGTYQMLEIPQSLLDICVADLLANPDVIKRMKKFKRDALKRLEKEIPRLEKELDLARKSKENLTKLFT